MNKLNSYFALLLDMNKQVTQIYKSDKTERFGETPYFRQEKSLENNIKCNMYEYTLKQFFIISYLATLLLEFLLFNQTFDIISF